MYCSSTTQYEIRTEKAPAALLPQIGGTPASADERLDIKLFRKLKKPNMRLHRRLPRIEKLDSRAKRQIIRSLDAFIEREELKLRANAQGAWR